MAKKEEKKKVNPDGSVVGYTPAGHTIVDNQGNQISVTRSQFEDYNRKQGQDYVNAKLAAKGQAAVAREQGVTPEQGAALQSTQAVQPTGSLSSNPIVRAQQEAQLQSEQTTQTLTEQGAFDTRPGGVQFDTSTPEGREIMFNEISATGAYLSPVGAAINYLGSKTKVGQNALQAFYGTLSEDEILAADLNSYGDQTQFTRELRKVLDEKQNRSTIQKFEDAMAATLEGSGTVLTKPLRKYGLLPKTPSDKVDDLVDKFGEMSKLASQQVQQAQNNPDQAFRILRELEDRSVNYEAKIYSLIRESKEIQESPERAGEIEDAIAILRNDIDSARQQIIRNSYTQVP